MNAATETATFRCLYCSAPVEPGDAVCAKPECLAKWQRADAHETSLPDETSVAGLAMMIQADPIRASMWLLNLAAEVRIQRAQLETLTQKLGAITLGVQVTP